MALSEAGGHKLVHCVRMITEMYSDMEDFVVVNADIKKCAISVSRSAIIETLESEPSCAN